MGSCFCSGSKNGTMLMHLNLFTGCIVILGIGICICICIGIGICSLGARLSQVLVNVFVFVHQAHSYLEYW